MKQTISVFLAATMLLSASAVAQQAPHRSFKFKSASPTNNADPMAQWLGPLPSAHKGDATPAMAPKPIGPARPPTVVGVGNPVCEMLTQLGIIVPGNVTAVSPSLTFCTPPRPDYVLGIGNDSMDATWLFYLTNGTTNSTNPQLATLEYGQTCPSDYSEVAYRSFNATVPSDTGSGSVFVIQGLVYDAFGDLILTAQVVQGNGGPPIFTESPAGGIIEPCDTGGDGGDAKPAPTSVK